MALIRHLCTKCGHPDYRCGCKTPQLGKPELAPTFDVAGQRIERIAKPGQRFGDGIDNGFGHTGGTSVNTCGCPDCQALYAKLTAA